MTLIRQFVAPLVGPAILGGILAMAFGCHSADSHPAETTTVETPAELVASPLGDDQLQRCAALMASLPEQSRPTFSPALDAIDSRGLTADELIRSHRLAYEAALEPSVHADVWERTPAVAVALREHGLTALQLAQTLTQVSCAHQSARLLDLNELRADATLNLSRLAASWDAGGQTEIDRLGLAQAIGELVALEDYLTLLAHVPESNQRIAQQHWHTLESFLPTVQLRKRLEQIVEFEQSQPAPLMSNSTSEPAIQQTSGTHAPTTSSLAR